MAAVAAVQASTSARYQAFLKWAARSWIAVAALGQGLFAGYVLVLYGRAAWAGDFERWNSVFPRGYRAGEPLANLLVAVHLSFTVLLVVIGFSQLWAALRRRAPALHRWNGRLYLLGAVLMAISGWIMLSHPAPSTTGLKAQATALNGLVMLLCAAAAWRAARRRDWPSHRRWALRLLLAVSGVWFFRLGLMLWLMIWRAPVGFDPQTFQGPFLDSLAFAQFLLPLAVLQLYFIAEQRRSTAWNLGAGLSLTASTTLTAAGIAAATLGLWLPRI
jgi:hypothetical protein